MLLAAPFVRVTVPQQFLLAITVLMIAMHFFQQSAVSEGRYRLIVEPLIVTAALLCLRAIWRPGPASLTGLVRARYLRFRTG